MTILNTLSDQSVAQVKHRCLAEVQSRTVVGTGKGTKLTFLIELRLLDNAFPFAPGDSISFLPQNHPVAVEVALKAFQLQPSDEIFSKRKQKKVTAVDYFSQEVNFSKCTQRLLDAFSVDPGVFTEPFDAQTILEKMGPIEIDRDSVSSLFLPLTPRFYSIASSKKWKEGQVDLLISETSYEIMGSKRYGVASHYLCHRTPMNTSIEIQLHQARQFFLPAPEVPVIMIGPGTGVAPFRSFIQERICQGAQGGNWLFFGERHRDTDFFFSEFWEEAQKEISLRVDCAFSRDQSEKIYVQHLLLQHEREIWDWVEHKGANLYICGDAEKMAKDVEDVLRQIATLRGHADWVSRLRKEKRLLLDVY